MIELNNIVIKLFFPRRIYYEDYYTNTQKRPNGFHNSFMTYCISQ